MTDITWQVHKSYYHYDDGMEERTVVFFQLIALSLESNFSRSEHQYIDVSRYRNMLANLMWNEGVTFKNIKFTEEHRYWKVNYLLRVFIKGNRFMIAGPLNNYCSRISILNEKIFNTLAGLKAALFRNNCSFIVNNDYDQVFGPDDFVRFELTYG